MHANFIASTLLHRIADGVTLRHVHHGAIVVLCLLVFGVSCVNALSKWLRLMSLKRNIEVPVAIPAPGLSPGMLPAAENRIGTMFASPIPAMAKPSTATAGTGAAAARPSPTTPARPEIRSVCTAPSANPPAVLRRRSARVASASEHWLLIDGTNALYRAFLSDLAARFVRAAAT